jgi:site-specific DNA recombinase
MNNNNNKAALYCRLSKEDMDKINKGDDSESIINQKLLLEEYAVNNGFSIYRTYQDDDYSGLFDDRPGFEKMINDARQGKFNTVIAKTQSRFTRNMEHMEHYLHDLFPLWGIRFIGVVDNVDTENKGNKKTRQINGLINEWYCEDLSENIKAVFKSKKRQGQYISSSPPYGYLKDPQNNHALIIDEYAANIIRRIFKMYLSGVSKYQISKTLSDEGVLIPSKYKNDVLKIPYHNPRVTQKSKWSAQTVHAILKDEVYIGTLVQNKYTTISYKNRKKMVVPDKERIKVYNTHEPIIDMDTWNLTQQALKQRTREVKMDKKVDLFSGKLYCPDCGKSLIRAYNRKHEFIGYHCSTYKKFGNNGCTSHQIGFKELKNITLSAIKETANNILNPEDVDCMEEFAQQLIKNPQKTQLKQLEDKLKTLTIYIDKIYKDYLDEILSRDDYIKYRGQYNEEKNEVQSQIEALITQLNNEKNSEINKNIWLKNFINYINIDELDRVIILELIDRIEVSNSGDVHIKFRFSYQ